MHGSPDKIAKLEELARLRRRTVWDGYRNIGDFHGGIYDSLHVSPYTRGAGNCDSRVFLLLQDWCSADYLDKLTDERRTVLASLGRDPCVQTNRTLTKLVHDHLGLSLEQCYATNLFPFIKPASMSASIPRQHMLRAAREFAIPQIETVRPKHVICLGRKVFEPLWRAMGQPPLRSGVSDSLGSFVWRGIDVWAQFHPACRGKERTMQPACWSSMVESSKIKSTL